MASPESAPLSESLESVSASVPSSNSTATTSPPTSAPPPSPPPDHSPPPASPPPSSPPASPPPSSPPPTENTPPPSPAPTPPAPSNSPPPSSPSPSQTPESPSPPSSSPSPPHPANSTTPATGSPSASIFSPPPADIISSPTPPAPAGKVTPSPPSSGKAPPKSSSTPSGSRSSSPSPPSSSDSSTAIIIAGIIVGGVLILALIIVCLICSKKKKKQPYYIDTGRPPKPGDPYYNASTPTQWNSSQAQDHIVKLPPPPGAMGTPSPLGPGAGSWGPSPVPPAANNTSSDFSSGYSGQHHPHMGPPSPIGGIGGGLGFSRSQFTYEELAAATGGFCQVNLLGQGGFGYVHKGVLPDGREVAVKSLKSGSGQGEREFQAEVEIISRVHHRHLVSLVGYCIAEGQRMLVYEYVPNKTLEYHLHGKGQPVMAWPIRLQIALGSAKGLSYLHEDCHPRIIHRDIKAANILLDDKYEAMVADFGLAKLTSDNYTHVSTRVMGTFGYLAPEYASSGKLTEKSDVFSFGVMLLELITGRKPVDPTGQIMEDSLVDWARPLMTRALEDGNYDELVDPRLEENYAPHEIDRMIACASASIRHSARRRPKMSQIVRALEGDSSLEDLNDAQKTAGNAGFSSSGSNETQTYDTGMYNADMMKFRKMVMSSQEFASSEFGGTSEYGLNPSSSSSDEFGHSGQQKKKP